MGNPSHRRRNMRVQEEGVDERGRLIKRRSFLNYCIGMSLCTFGGTAVYSFGKYLFPPDTLGGEAEGEVIRIALGEIPIGGAKIVRYKGEPSIIVRTTEKSVHVLSAVCTHLGCLVKWDSVKATLVCPCHAASFDVNGNVIGGPAPRPLQTHPVKIAQEEIIIGEA
jgi:cytochrome b6-f complex iron-sulfur subunit